MISKKTCSICGEEKAARFWNRSRQSGDGLSSYCKACSGDKKKRERAAKQGYYRDEVAKTVESLRTRVLERYATGRIACARCGYHNRQALTVDAVARSHKNSGPTLWKWLIRNGYPGGFEVICMNCREIKRQDEKLPQSLTTQCRIIARPS